MLQGMQAYAWQCVHTPCAYYVMKVARYFTLFTTQCQHKCVMAAVCVFAPTGVFLDHVPAPDVEGSAA